jgi:hypothetical protein
MSGAVRIVARDRSDLLGEGPVWSARESALLMIGWVIERAAAPGFIAGFASGFAELTLEPLRIEPIVDPEPDRPQNRLNDAKADHCGRIWAGSMPVAANEPSGCLHCLHCRSRGDARGFGLHDCERPGAESGWQRPVSHRQRAARHLQVPAPRRRIAFRSRTLHRIPDELGTDSPMA